MAEQTPLNPEDVLGNRLQQLRLREENARFEPRFRTVSVPFPDTEVDEEREEPRDSVNISYVYEQGGPLMWLRERKFYPYSSGYTEPSRFLIGLIVMDEKAHAGNQLRVAVFRPESPRAIHTITTAALQRETNPLLPYHIDSASQLTNKRQMEAYPLLSSVPEEINFFATADAMLRQGERGHLHYPALIPKSGLMFDEETPPMSGIMFPEQKRINWPLIAAGLGLTGIASYAFARHLHSRSTTSK